MSSPSLNCSTFHWHPTHIHSVSDDLTGVEGQTDILLAAASLVKTHWNEGKGIKLEFDEENPVEVTGEENFDNFEEFFDDVDENNDDEDYDPTYEIKEQVNVIFTFIFYIYFELLLCFRICFCFLFQVHVQVPK